jgi:hypothetical protein
MSEDIVTIARVPTAMEANMIKGRLEFEGVPCFIADEHTISIQPLYNNAIGGVRVQVRLSDVERAKQILNREVGSLQNLASLDHALRREKISLVEQPSIVEKNCPVCGSRNGSYSKRGGVLNILSSLGLGVFFPSIKRRWICRNCN